MWALPRPANQMSSAQGHKEAGPRLPEQSWLGQDRTMHGIPGSSSCRLKCPRLMEPAQAWKLEPTLSTGSPSGSPHPPRGREGASRSRGQGQGWHLNPRQPQEAKTALQGPGWGLPGEQGLPGRGAAAPHSQKDLGRWTALGNSAHLSGLLGPCAWPVSSPQKEQRKSHLSFKPEVEIPPEEDPCLHNDRVTCTGSQLSSHPARLGLSSAQRPESCPPVAQGGLHWTGQQVQVAGTEAPWSNGDILRNHALSRAGPPHAGQLCSPQGPSLWHNI